MARLSVRFLIALTMLCTGVLFAGAPFGGGPQASALSSVPYSPTGGTIFNNPRGSKTQQLAIITQINRSLDAAPRGATVRMAQYLFDIDSTADKMIAAHKRGVHVQVLIDDGEKNSQISRVRSALGTDKRKLSFVATCSHSCMADTASVMHAKFYLFSNAGSARLVSMISSANPYTGNTFKSWNDIHTIVGDSAIYNSLVRYFTDMLRDRDDLNYFRTTTSGRYKAYLFPRAAQPGVNTIALLDVLNHVKCTGVAAGYGRGGRTVIRIAQWGWTSARLDIARRLWALHNAGCKVEVIYNSGVTSRTVTATLLKRSTAYGVMRVYDSWVDGNHNGFASKYMHLKLMTINGVWFGHTNTKVVYTGSQNYTGPATRVNNDLILRIVNPTVHDAYVRNLDYIRDHYPKRVTTVPPATTANSEKRVSQLANAEDGVQ